MLTTKNTTGSRKLPPDTRKVVSSSARAAGSFVPKLAAKAFEKFGFHSAEIMTAWNRVAGADLAQFTEPDRIKWPRGHDSRKPGEGNGAGEGAILVLRVDPARALDVEYRAAEIIDRINRYFGYRAIASLKIVQAPMTGRRQADRRDEMTRTVVADPPPCVADMPEAGLKTALTQLWTSIATERARR